MLVNKTVEFFLSEAAGRSGRSAGAGGGLGAARDRTGCRREPRLGPGQDAGGKITGQAAGSERPGTGRDAGENRGLG